jgi:dihydroflavonol-4-reductase
VVIVNPSTPVGARDVKPTPTGEIILRFLQDRMPAYVHTGLNLIDVEDVAQGHILAWRKGRTGERYILGNRNLSLKEMLEMLAAITGKSAPRIALPHSIPLAAAFIDEMILARLGKKPQISFYAAQMSRKAMYYDSSKAVSELGLPQTPIETAMGKAVSWFEENGYF